MTKTASATVSLTNQAPTISNIANQNINEDGTKTVSFSISDRETPAGQLSLSKSSSNTTLLPSGNITFGGSGGSRTVTLKPAANKSGSTTITISVSDGEKTVQDSFILTVNAVNDTPTISNIANQAINEDGSKTISFSVSDVETANGSLTLSATSSNTALLPISRITFGGSGGSRTVTLKPVANKSGSATVIITVSDGSKSASDSFLLTVNPVNDVPVIGVISDKTTNMNTTVELIVAISDVETSLSSLQVSASSSNTTLLPNNQIQLASHSGGKRIILTPVRYKSGSATVTLTVNDGTASVNKSFTLTIKEPGGLVSYRYDELGRLVKVVGTDGKTANYQYDKSDNRTNKSVSE
ncbi:MULTISPECIES: Ig-like domain-containing protein [unclassified Microbulbifer]|uniref:RHS repeat domain-containing protein n=1 Tax=unclassified Microbulbifer TaxID=2619833 RepID=UPI0027E4D770|nr:MULTISPECIES: Ig-like domain-containing protein [unclassified Microbulbifer]